MKLVNVHEAKTHLSRLLEDVANGHEVTIAKAGKPIARLVPIAGHPTQRAPGYLRGRIRIAQDFDTPLPEDVQSAFEGER